MKNEKVSWQLPWLLSVGLMFAGCTDEEKSKRRIVDSGGSGGSSGASGSAAGTSGSVASASGTGGAGGSAAGMGGTDATAGSDAAAGTGGRGGTDATAGSDAAAGKGGRGTDATAGEGGIGATFCDDYEIACSFRGKNYYSSMDDCLTQYVAANEANQTCRGTHLGFVLDMPEATQEYKDTHCGHAAGFEMCN